MLFLIAFVGAAVVALVLWKAMNTAQRRGARRRSADAGAGPSPPRGSAARTTTPSSCVSSTRRCASATTRPPPDAAARPGASERVRPATRQPARPRRRRPPSAASSSSASRVRRLEPVQVDLRALLEVRVERDPHHRAAARREVLGHPVQVDPARRAAHRVDHRDGVAHQVAVAVRVEPVHASPTRCGRRRSSRTTRSPASRPRPSTPVHRRVHQTGAAVGEHDVVEVLEQRRPCAGSRPR